ncbi:MAG: synthase epsilon chain [Bacillota bacterium]|jgi:F-type H+-transporting ATPase subunit epsilon
MNFPVLIITPKRKVYDGQVELLSVMTTAGQLGILANHTPLLTILKTGPMHMIVDKKTTYFAVSGGVLSVQKNQTILLVDAIERADEIDITRAKDAMKRAEERLKEKTEKIDEARAKAALSRALNRIQVAESNNKR